MIKMYWDFYGDDGLKTAEHHCVHLKEFCERNKLQNYETGIVKGEGINSAWVMVDEKNMLMVRDALRPKRGEKIG